MIFHVRLQMIFHILSWLVNIPIMGQFMPCNKPAGYNHLYKPNTRGFTFMAQLTFTTSYFSEGTSIIPPYMQAILGTYPLVIYLIYGGVLRIPASVGRCFLHVSPICLSHTTIPELWEIQKIYWVISQAYPIDTLW